MKTGDLVIHSSESPGMPAFGIGIIIESWESQISFEDVPEHDPDDMMVMFDDYIRIVSRLDCRKY